MSRALIQSLIADVPDYPKPGILFRDITPVLAHAQAFRAAVELLAEPYLQAGIETVVGIEARGFMFAAPLAIALGAAFVPVRKPGKLPRARERAEYALEYGNDALEMHSDALDGRRRVLLVDDVIATGGTARASLELLARAGADIVAAAFLIELTFLQGRAALGDTPMHSVISY